MFYLKELEPLKVDVYGNGGIIEDQNVNLTSDDGWARTAMGWSVVPWGCGKLLRWIDERYDRPPIYITENGGAFHDRVVDGQIDDQDRLSLIRDYLASCHGAMSDGVDLRGYFAWSLMDNFEWASGYSIRFGLYHTDFPSGRRIARTSAHWYRDVIRQNALPDSGT